MKRPSEEMRAENLEGFELTGNYEEDLKRYCKHKGRKLEEAIPAHLELRLALGNPMTVYQLTEGVCKKITAVRIECLPDEYPRFLKKPFLIESKPGNYLFDDIHTIGGYINEKDVFMLMAYCDENSIQLKKENPFNGIRLEEINFVSKDDFAENYKNRAKNILPFVTVLALMLEAEKSPVLTDEGSKKARKKSKSEKKAGHDGWIERRIYIDAKYNANAGNREYLPMDKDGKIKRDVFITGFLRYQPYGPKHTLRKWIYVDGFETTRWINKEDKKIILDVKKSV